MPELLRSGLCVCVLVAVTFPHATHAEGQNAAAKARAPDPTDEDAEIKVTGVTLAGVSVRAGRAVGIVNAPIKTVTAIVEDYGAYETFMPHFRASRVLSRRGASALVYMQASVAMDTMTLWAQLKIGPRPNAGKTRIIEAKMIKGNMDAMHARWELTPVDGQHTLVAFQLLLDPKVPLPTSLVSNENEKASQKTIRALRRVVAERGAATAKR